jgi:hypothetical protein
MNKINRLAGKKNNSKPSTGAWRLKSTRCAISDKQTGTQRYHALTVHPGHVIHPFAMHLSYNKIFKFSSKICRFLKCRQELPILEQDTSPQKFIGFLAFFQDCAAAGNARLPPASVRYQRGRWRRGLRVCLRLLPLSSA